MVTAAAKPILDYAPRPQRVWPQRMGLWLQRCAIVVAGGLLGWLVGACLTPARYTNEIVYYVLPQPVGGRQTSLDSIALQMIAPNNVGSAKASQAGTQIPARAWTEAKIESKHNRKADLIEVTITHRDRQTTADLGTALHAATVANILGSDPNCILKPPQPANMLLARYSSLPRDYGILLGVLLAHIVLAYQRRLNRKTNPIAGQPLK